jgi:DNA-binding XRE family transcriptional regulator
MERIAGHLGVTRQAVHFALKKLRRGEATCCHCKERFAAPEGAATTRNVFCLSCLNELPDIPLGRRVASLRIIVGFTQEELARHIGVTYGLISSLERGICRPRKRTGERMFAVLASALAKARRVSSA